MAPDPPARKHTKILRCTQRDCGLLLDRSAVVSPTAVPRGAPAPPPLAVVESFWARMQTELLDRRTWRTRTELSTEIFDWIEVLYNRTRRHSGLGMLAPIAYEKLHANDISAA